MCVLRPSVVRGLLLLASGLVPACDSQQTPNEVDSLVSSTPLTLSPQVPSDIPGGAPTADLSSAAMFAWEEFVALNWPAVPQTGTPGTRGAANTTASFGSPSDALLVWETFRGKVEIYPGNGNPNGYTTDPTTSFGFDGAPQYVYSSDTVGSYPDLVAGQVPPDTGQAPVDHPAWINLDEDNEIEEDAMFAGAATTSPFPGQQFLYAAKANRSEYAYVAAKQWWDSSLSKPVKDSTADYIYENKRTPPPDNSDYVSFPSGTIEVKTAWRRLTSAELASGRFHTSRIRYYVSQSADQTYGGLPGDTTRPAYREEVWGMAALHIIHKTPTAPYFTYATFEQIDNILTVAGEPVEDAAGNVVNSGILAPMDPVINSVPATPEFAQILTADGPSPDPGKRLYYLNLPGIKVPAGNISVNRRIHSIPPEVIEANQAYQSAIATYDSVRGNRSPWPFYRLVNIQFRPLDKAPREPYTGPDSATYYLSNIVVETDYNLQVFSGKLDDPGDTDGLITDYYNDHNSTVGSYQYPIGTAAHNVPYGGRFYNMGGCMGCHGNIAELGSDFSFVFAGGRVSTPEFALKIKGTDQ